MIRRPPDKVLLGMVPCARVALLIVLPLLVNTAAAQTIDGNVESGNIGSVTLVGPAEYDLEIRPDTGAANKQWFYFTVADAGGMMLTFHVLDFDAQFKAGILR